MTHLSKKITLAALAAAVLALSACTAESNSGAKKETAATKNLLDAKATIVGIPAIKNYTEAKQLKMLYELRDTADLVTYTYIVTIDGTLKPVCPTTSIGFGMPFSAQFTAPTIDLNKGADGYGSAGATFTHHQPEPNGLYMPDSTTATWVICLSKDGERLNPVYVEPTIMVSLEPLE